MSNNPDQTSWKYLPATLSLQGGLKAAILADVMQGLTMIAISVAIIIQGCVEAGGFVDVFNISKKDGRLDFFK